MNLELLNAAIVNESQTPDVVGDVSLFENLENLAAWAEPHDVTNHEYFAYTLSGQRLDLRVENGRVLIVKVGEENASSMRVTQLLEMTAERVLNARRNDPAKIAPKTMSIRELVELIGFTR